VGRRQPIVAMIVVLVLVGCGSAPIPAPPASVPVPAGTVPPSGDGTPPASPPASSPGPNVSPAATAATWRPWAVPDGQSATVKAVGTDGTIYVETFEIKDDVKSNVGLVALGPDGAPRTGWTAPSVSPASDITMVVAAPDGGVYMAEQAADKLVVHGLDATGSARPGWPVTVAGAVMRPFMVVDRDGALRFGWSERGGDRAVLETLGVDGTRPSGWPVELPGGRPFLASVGRDGTAYVSVVTGQDPIMSPTRSLAIGPDGKQVPGWAEFTTKDGYHARDVALERGLVRVAYDMGDGGHDSYTWLDSTGKAVGPKAAGPPGMTEFDVVAGPGDSLYAADYTCCEAGAAGPGKLFRYGPDGKPMAGWPVSLEGWPERPLVAPDGTVWTIEHLSPAKVQFVAFGPDGAPLAGTPVAATIDETYTDAALGPDGSLFSTDRSSGPTLVVRVQAPG